MRLVPETILIVDDEKSILLTLEKLIKRAYPDVIIIKAEDGLEAWNTIRQVKPDVVISDLRMPKLDGFQLCNRVRANDEVKDTYFLIVTAVADPDKKIQALEIGVDDYLNKPLVQEEIIARLKTAFRLIKIQKKIGDENKLLNELADELENTIEDATNLALKIFDTRMAASSDSAKRISKAAAWIAKELHEFSEEQIKDIEIAGLFSLSGRMVLPDTLVNKPVELDGHATDNLMYLVPVVAKDLVTTVRRFKDCGEILYHVYENFDGSGFPDRLQSWQIPLASRVLRVVVDYETIKEHYNLKPRDVIQRMFNEVKRLYDQRAVILLDQYVKSVVKEDYDPTEKAIKLHELAPGMVLTQDIVTSKGLKLLSMGAVVRLDIIEKIQQHNSSDPILGRIYIRKGT